MSLHFSIVMPTYNRGWILADALERIQKQNFTDWELIVIDDGSTDDTRQIVEGVARHDSRIHYIFQENAGQSAARQNGLEQAAGKWVTYVDSDDELYPTYLSTAQTFFQSHPAVTYAMAFMDRTLELHDSEHHVLVSLDQPATELNPKEVTLRDFAHWKIKPCGTGIFHRRDIVRDGIHWNTSVHAIEDLDFVFQLGVRYPDAFGYIPTPLFHQRQAYGNEGICSNTSYADWAESFEGLYLRFKDAWFMKGQAWYPQKIEEYRERQRLFDLGQYPSTVERYFPEYFKK